MSPGPTPLLDATLGRLASDRATRGIPATLAHPAYDRGFGEWICQLTRALTEARGRSYEDAVADFIAASAEFIRLQRQLERTGRYACPSFDAARRAIYDDHALMSSTYLNALLLSQALWINHQRLFALFRERFCRTTPDAGSVLEAPLGTGLFLSEFLEANPRWDGVGVDLSPACVEFARSLLERRLPGRAIALAAEDVLAFRPSRAFDRIICGELLEHVDAPAEILRALDRLLASGGRVFLTTAIWAANPDHVYLFESAAEVRALLSAHFRIEEEAVLPLEQDASPEEARIPINYGCILGRP